MNPPSTTKPAAPLSDGQKAALVNLLGEIAARTALGEFETTKSVFKLLDTGHLSLSPP